MVGYARTSTTDQNLDAQIELLHDAGADRIYHEKISGVSKNRPELVALLDYVRKGDTVVICKIDRIARNTKHLLEIVETLKIKGVTLKILDINIDTNTPTGKLMLTMIGAVATFEREIMLERQKEGITRAKEQGLYKGRKPTARAKSKQVLELLAKGMTKQAVADTLNIGVASVYRITKSNMLK